MLDCGDGGEGCGCICCGGAAGGGAICWNIPNAFCIHSIISAGLACADGSGGIAGMMGGGGGNTYCGGGGGAGCAAVCMFRNIPNICSIIPSI